MFFIFIKRTFESKNSQKEINHNQDLTQEKLSVFIPFHGEWELIRPCLDSVLKQKYQGEIKIFVITNEENNTKLKNLIPAVLGSKRSIQCLISKDDQKSRKLNLGLSLVNDEYVAFLDADHIADEEWISSGLSYLKQNPRWSGIQGRRSPIKRKGIIYAWDSFVNHLGNELLNLIRFKSQTSIPFTGTTAIFKKETFHSEKFGDSITEDTEWYFKKINHLKKNEFYIGYDLRFGSSEIMSHDLNTFIKRRIRWASGHTKAYFDNFGTNNKSLFQDPLVTLHGVHYLVSVPITFWFFANSFFLFLQMNQLIQFGTGFCSLGLSLLLRRHPSLSKIKPWVSILFGFFLTMAIILILNQFGQIGIDTIISRFGMVLLPGSDFFIKINFSIFILFFLFSWMIQIRNFNLNYVIKSFFFSIFLIPLEIYTSFSGVIHSLSEQEMSWKTERALSKSYYDRVISFLLVLIFFSTLWVVLDGRSISSFIKDVSAFQNRSLKRTKKTFPFSKDNLLRGVAINAPVNKKILEKLSEVGVNSIRFYKDPGTKWVNISQQYDITSILQPSFSNWDHVDVRLPWARWILLWNLFYLDSKYESHPSVPLVLIGNEIEIWAFAHLKEEEQKDKSRKDFFSIFKDIEKELKNTHHHFSIASTVVDSTTASPLLFPNTLTTSFQYWDDYLPSLPTNTKSTIAGEWGGFQAPDDNPPDWLRLHRSEIQWQYLKELGFVGGYFFALQDNRSQPRMNSFNDPLNSEDPEDKRGILDDLERPKEEYWLLAYLYGPVSVYKSNDQFFIENNSNLPLTIGQKVINPRTRIDGTEMIKKAKDNLYGTFPSGKRILIYHPEGRLTGCEMKIDHTFTGTEQNVFVAEYRDYRKLKASNAILHSGGRKGLTEIHPSQKDWSIEGIDKNSLRILKPCRKPFFKERKKEES